MVFERRCFSGVFCAWNSAMVGGSVKMILHLRLRLRFHIPIPHRFL